MSLIAFLAFADDRSQPGRILSALEPERRALGLAFRQWETGRCHVSDGGLSALIEDLQREREHMVLFHFGGHANGISLHLEQKAGTGEALASKNLATLLGSAPHLRFVFLNACATKDHVKLLLKAGVPAIIATDKAINDHQAKKFGETFYRGLVGGTTLVQAFQEARIELEGNQSQDRIYRDISFEDGDTSNEDVFPWGLYCNEETSLQWCLHKSQYSVPGTPNLNEDEQAKKEQELIQGLQLFDFRKQESAFLNQLRNGPNGFICLIRGKQGHGQRWLLNKLIGMRDGQGNPFLKLPTNQIEQIDAREYSFKNATQIIKRWKFPVGWRGIRAEGPDGLAKQLLDFYRPHFWQGLSYLTLVSHLSLLTKEDIRLVIQGLWVNFAQNAHIDIQTKQSKSRVGLFLIENEEHPQNLLEVLREDKAITPFVCILDPVEPFSAGTFSDWQTILTSWLPLGSTTFSPFLNPGFNPDALFTRANPAYSPPSMSVVEPEPFLYELCDEIPEITYDRIVAL